MVASAHHRGLGDGRRAARLRAGFGVGPVYLHDLLSWVVSWPGIEVGVT